MVERQRHVLNDKLKKVVHKLSGHKPCRSMVIAYQARQPGKVVGTAKDYYRKYQNACTYKFSEHRHSHDRLDGPCCPHTEAE